VRHNCRKMHLEPLHLQCFDMIYDDNGKSSGLPRGMPLVTRVFASSEHAWDPMASSSVNSYRKTRTVPHFSHEAASTAKFFSRLRVILLKESLPRTATSGDDARACFRGGRVGPDTAYGFGKGLCVIALFLGGIPTAATGVRTSPFSSFRAVQRGRVYG
jgi:hypothetical protein